MDLLKNIPIMNTFDSYFRIYIRLKLLHNKTRYVLESCTLEMLPLNDSS